MTGPPAATIDTLLREAARRHPRTIVAPQRTDFGGLDALADHYAARLREALARLGDAAVVVVAPTAQSIAAIVGALRAGLALSVAPPEINGRELDTAILGTDASILAGPARFAGLATGDLMCRVAVDQERVSLVATHGGEISGVLALDSARESYTAFEPRRVEAQIRFATSSNGQASRFEEGELIAAAESITQLAHIRAGDVILTTLSPASAPGLAAGPLAALSSGARLVFHAPFESRAFQAALDAAAPVHLVLPQALRPAFKASGVLDDGRVSSLILSCASDTEAPIFHHAPGDPVVLCVTVGPWGGMRVEAVAADGGAPRNGDGP